MNEHRSEVQTGSGVRFTAVTDADARDDPISAALRAGQFPLAPLFDLARRIVPAGGRIVDLGGHVGSFSLACAAAGYQVLCVEASPRNAALIDASVRANGFANFTLFNVAVSDRPGSLKFHSQGPYGHVAPEGYGGDTVEVEAVTVDSLIERARWPRADFIKLDIEGSEVAAVRGMPRTMAVDPAPVLFCESNGHMLEVFGQTPQTLKTALAELGCEIYLAQERRLVRVQPGDPQGSTVVDYLAVKRMPAPLRDWHVVDGLTHGAIVKELERAARSQDGPERLYAARVLRDSGAEFRGLPGVEAIRELLCRDTSHEVRDIALAIPAAPTKKKPWWRFRSA